MNFKEKFSMQFINDIKYIFALDLYLDNLKKSAKDVESTAAR